MNKPPNGECIRMSYGENCRCKLFNFTEPACSWHNHHTRHDGVHTLQNCFAIWICCTQASWFCSRPGSVLLPEHGDSCLSCVLGRMKFLMSLCARCGVKPSIQQIAILTQALSRQADEWMKPRYTFNIHGWNIPLAPHLSFYWMRASEKSDREWALSKYERIIVSKICHVQLISRPGLGE